MPCHLMSTVGCGDLCMGDRQACSKAKGRSFCNKHPLSWKLSTMYVSLFFENLPLFFSFVGSLIAESFIVKCVDGGVLLRTAMTIHTSVCVRASSTSTMVL